MGQARSWTVLKRSLSKGDSLRRIAIALPVPESMMRLARAPLVSDGFVRRRPGGVEAAAFKLALLEQASAEGFPLAGIAGAEPAATGEAFRDWLDAGHAGEMDYMAHRPERRLEPARLWPAAGSVLVVGLPHSPPSGEEPPGTAGRVAAYALGEDYHRALRRRLNRVREWVLARGVRARAYVDSGPLLERDLAARAGLGWFGKNTCLLERRAGSYFLLGALVLDLPLPPDGPVSAHCGTCTRCLDACPTGAFVSPYVLDARRCISYLTIELRGPIPRDLRPLVGRWVFGCDVCQQVCPWNRKLRVAPAPELAPRPDVEFPLLEKLALLDEAGYRDFTRQSALRRVRREGLVRNACVALGNSGDLGAVPVLGRALDDVHPLARGHAAWALGRLGGEEARGYLARRASMERDAWVREELDLARAEA